MSRAIQATSLFVALAIAIIVPGVIYAQCCEYTGQDQGMLSSQPAPLQFGVPALGNYAPWHNYAIFGGSTGYSELKYYTTSGISSYVGQAITSWNNPLPDWATWISVSDKNTANLRILDVSQDGSLGSCTPVGAVGCFRIDTWNTNLTRNVNEWSRGYILIDYGNTGFPIIQVSQPTEWKQAIVSHELGHAIGLHERYDPTAGCNSDYSIMDRYISVSDGHGGLKWRSCDDIQFPTATDNARVENYYTKGQYNNPPVGNTWIAKINGKLHTKWSDWTWQDWQMKLELYKWETIAYVGKNYKYHIPNIGIHNDIRRPLPTPTPRVIYSTNMQYDDGTVFDPSPYGAGSYVVCATPIIGQNGSVLVTGLKVCAGPIAWP